MAIVLAACNAASGPTPLRDEGTPGPLATGTPTAPSSPTPDRPGTPTAGVPRNLRFYTGGWRTDFAKHSVSLEEIASGGPSKDGIPAIDRPKFIGVAEANGWLKDKEPVQVVEMGGETRVYPLQVLIWHEIVNDVVGGKPITVTYCPLCNTTIVFDASLPGRGTLDFGTTGNLRFSDLVMYDRQTESWWQQATGEAIVGELTGRKLQMLPSPLLSWGEVKHERPQAKVLSRETGFERPYGQNPYIGYDSGYPFLYRGPEDSRLPALERIVAVEIGGAALVVPYAELQKKPIVHYTLAGKDLVIFYRPGTASALDAEAISAGRDVGSVTAFEAVLEGRRLTFHRQGDGIVDDQTGSTWGRLGQAESGPLAGRRLTPIVYAPAQFWFSWAVFRPDAVIYRGVESTP